MDEALVRARLAQADWHITLSERTIAGQRDTISRLRSGGLSTTVAEDTLRIFEQTQAAHMADRDRILRGLRVGNPIASTLFWLSGP